MPSKEVPFRVMRGMRLKQPNYVSDEIYQLLLTCWQVDLDERPAFEDIVHHLKGLLYQHHHNTQMMTINFHCLTNNFVHETYKNDLEIL